MRTGSQLFTWGTGQEFLPWSLSQQPNAFGRMYGFQGSEPRYLFHSVEAQIRSLAEAAAMLQDWDLALNLAENLWLLAPYIG